MGKAMNLAGGGLMSLLVLGVAVMVMMLVQWPGSEPNTVSLRVQDSAVLLNRRVDTEGKVLRIIADDRKGILRGLGYAHAKDRLVQMYLLKIVASGRLSELLVDSPATRRVDMSMREEQFARLASEAMDLLTPRALQELEWYSEGVNAFLETQPVPMDMRLAGIDPRQMPWTPQDSMMTVHIMAVMGLADIHLMTEKFIIQAVQSKKVDIERLKVIFAPFLNDLDSSTVELLRKVKMTKSVIPEELLFAGELLPTRGLGSNAWAVAPDFSASGSPILCSDPHLDVARLPPIWYEVELVEVKNVDASSRSFGISMPGLPGLVMFRNRKIAVGFTYGFGDHFDFFIEEIKDGKYRSGNEWVPLGETRDVIKTKNGDEVHIVMFHTTNGMIDTEHIVIDPELRTTKSLASNYLKDGFYLSRSTSLTAEAIGSGMDASLSFMTRDSARAVMEVGSRIHFSLNLVIADSEGNIAYQQSGALPKRPKGKFGILPLPGWKIENQWIENLQPDELVSVFNPSSGIVVSANNDVLDMIASEAGQSNEPHEKKDKLHRTVNLHMGSYRREKIIQLLKKKKKHTLETMREIQLNLEAPDELRFALMDILNPELEAQLKRNKSRSARALGSWDGLYAQDSVGALVFDRTYTAIMNEIYGKVFGRDMWSHFTGQTELFNMFSATFDRPVFFADNDPLHVFRNESKAELMQRVFRDVLYELDDEVEPVTWGEAEKFDMTNVLFRDKFPFSYLGWSYNSVPGIGGRGVICQAGRSLQHGSTKVFGPSWRMVCDLGNKSVSTTLPGGPSGNRFESSLYTAGIEDHLAGIYKTFDVAV